jgi:hypothetical protein
MELLDLASTGNVYGTLLDLASTGGAYVILLVCADVGTVCRARQFLLKTRSLLSLNVYEYAGA